MPGNEVAGEVVVARLATAEDEADWLAGRICAPSSKPVVRRGRSPCCPGGGSTSPGCTRRWSSRDIPVEVVGLGGLLAMPEVSDIVAMLSLLVDATANAAAVRVLSGPRWRLGVRDLAALGRRAGHLATWSPPGSESDDEPPAGQDLERALQAATDSVDPVELASLLDAVESPGQPAACSPEALQRLGEFAAEVRRLRRTGRCSRWST